QRRNARDDIFGREKKEDQQRLPKPQAMVKPKIRRRQQSVRRTAKAPMSGLSKRRWRRKGFGWHAPTKRMSKIRPLHIISPKNGVSTRLNTGSANMSLSTPLAGSIA